MHKINGHPWDVKNSIDLDSRPWHALTISSISIISALQQSPKPELMRPSEKKTCKKVFSLHLLNTVSFLVSYTAQHKEAAPVNNIKLCLGLPSLDQPLNKLMVLCGDEERYYIVI